MKKIISLIFLILALSSIQNYGQSSYRAALQKGSVLTGGNVAVSFGTQKYEYSSQYGSDESESGYNSFTLTPKAGYFLADGIALGLGLDLTSTTSKYDEDGEDSKETTTIYTIGPVFRYYAAGGFFAQGEIGFGKVIDKYTYDGDSEKDDGNITKWQLGIGYAFFLNDYVAVEPSVVYRNTIVKQKEDGSEFKGSLGEFVLGVGFTIFLHK